ncbi:FMO2, partial [Symbiodinium sp. KB8]
DRWHVRLENGEEKALRPSNLAVLAEQEPDAICPAVSQAVEVCSVSDRIPRLLQLMREVQESEKKGLRVRSLTLVLCADTDDVQKAAAALADRQLACIKLVEAGQQERAKRDFGLDGKRILVATDSALGGLRLPPEVSRL